MIGLVEHAARHWNEMLRAHAGADPESLSPFDRHRTYVVVATTADVSRADYWVSSDALYHPTLTEPWHRHLGPWHDTTTLTEPARSLLTAARFCADGAWMSEATGVFAAESLDGVQRQALALVDAAEQNAAVMREEEART
ncbi:hypothetical protein WDU99_03020 [Microbacterium sp. Mu-80]|uniref:TetR transcriptional regulator CgmR-like C-terminal domain-containing protein n=1 Tax=Microbacterium bandirmense TaxID=3122050 RepID=A0ABU8L7H4_9MICO